MLRVTRYWLLAALVVLGTPFGTLAARGQEATPVAVETPKPIALRVMTFNVWLGGVQVDFAQIVAAIQAADADVVGLQEAEGHTRQIAAALGWAYADERMQVISRYPLVDPPGANGLYTFIAPRPGQAIAIANVHLTSDPYGPDAVLAGSTPEEVQTIEEETRLPGLEAQLTRLPELIAAGISVFFTGDFNTPSHLDGQCCTRRTGGAIDSPLVWPVGKALADVGFVDSFRTAHPDATARPGLTWTPGYPHPFVAAEVPNDRIDWVLAAGEVEVLASEVVGEAGNSDVDIAVMPYPSDHRGVVSTFRVMPGESPLLVAVSQRAFDLGDEIVVRYHAPGDEGDRVVLVAAGGDAAADAIMSLPPREALQDGVVVFGSGTLAPGGYEAVLLGADDGELARIPFQVRVPGAAPTVTPDKPVYTAGAPIAIRWENAPGNKWDWIGVYAAGDPDLYNYLGFLYTDAALAGTVTFDETAFGAALPPGDYVARLMRDDGYVMLAQAPFTVR